MEKKSTDELGMIHQRYQQYYKGIKVENAEYMVHGKDNLIETMNGDFQIVSIASVTPALSEKQALLDALKYVNAKEYKWQDSASETLKKQLTNDLSATYYPEGELVISKDYLESSKSFKLSWKFIISSLQPNNEQIVYVDAINGDIINNVPLIYDANVPCVAQTRYSGNQNITGDTYSGGYRLREVRNSIINVQTLNAHNQSNYSNATDFSNTSTSWTTGSWANINQDQAALDAHWGAEMVVDYWKTVFNRNGIINNSSNVISYVHYYDPNRTDIWPNNAQWDGNNHVMRYGDGDGIIFVPLTALDVCAHEFGHGICQYTANLAYVADESGALNEGFSDIWGASIEHWAAPNKQTWLMGEEITLIAPGYLRSLSNPKSSLPGNGQVDTYHQTNWSNSTDPSVYSHQNMSVLSHWYYLLSQGGCSTNDLGNTFYVHGIGISDAQQIAWRTESQYLTSSANYAAASAASIQAAKDLFGVNSIQVHSVTNAWYAVGIGSSEIQPSISGAYYFCSGSSTYSIPELPQGSTVSYSISQVGSYATLSQANNQATLTKTGIGIVTLYANITTGCGTINVAKNIYVGEAVIGIDATQLHVCNGNSLEWILSVDQPSYGYNWNWTVGPLGVGNQIYIYSAFSPNTNVDVTGGGPVNLTYTDVCGNHLMNGVTVYSTCYGGYAVVNFTVAPNPAQNEVTVSAVANSHLMNAKTESVTASNLIYGIRITDVSGIVRKSFEYKTGIQSIKISVTGLNSGVYTLSVFDGREWQSQNIIVQK